MSTQVLCADRAERPQNLDSDSCAVTVEYDTTILPGGDPSILHQFDGPSYQAMINELATRVAATLRLRTLGCAALPLRQRQEEAYEVDRPSALPVQGEGGASTTPNPQGRTPSVTALRAVPPPPDGEEQTGAPRPTLGCCQKNAHGVDG